MGIILKFRVHRFLPHLKDRPFETILVLYNGILLFKVSVPPDLNLVLVIASIPMVFAWVILNGFRVIRRKGHSS